MGRIGRLLSFVRTTRNGAKISDVKVDPGGGPNITCEHFADAGDDAYPLDTDYVNTSEIPRNGGEVVTGYVDPLNTPKAQPGDKRIYARDADTGLTVVEVWLKSDGTATMFNSTGTFILRPDGSIKGNNGNGFFELESSGRFTVNNAYITPSGDIVSASGVSMNNHFHSQGNDSDGDSEVDVSSAIATE